MQNQWSEDEAAEFIERYGPKWGEDLALLAYCSRLLAAEKEFALTDAASLSVKGLRTNIFGESVPAMGIMEAGAGPDAGIALDLPYLRRMRGLTALPDRELIEELRTHVLHSGAPTPPPESLAHAFLPMKYVVYARSCAVLAAHHALDGSLVLVPSCGSAFDAASAAVAICEAQPGAQALIWANRGILTWGETARAAYASLIDTVTRAKAYLDRQIPSVTWVLPTSQEILARLKKASPIVRGLLARKMTDSGHLLSRVILGALTSPEINGLFAGNRGKELALLPPLISTNAAITKAFPMWVDSPDYGDPVRLHGQVSEALDQFERNYDEYYSRNAPVDCGQTARHDSAPRVVIMPGLGVLCAGPDVAASSAVRDAAEATLVPRSRVGSTAAWQALPESELFRGEYGTFARSRPEPAPLSGRIALVTGTAGAIGAGIAEGLLRNGCAVALADLPGKGLSSAFQEFRERYGELVMELPFDVAEPAEVADAFGKVILQWGGLDLVVSNAGIAHVSSLADMRLDAFRRLERVNIEGTLNILSECARHFSLQACGGDVVLISTKNVFAPGARFGAYSATKAAAHQLARIASREFAEMSVRVNMVAPDAVFRHGTRPSGLWTEVGPSRARSLGMTPEELEAYYRTRSLLKVEVTARHVANAVLYFATQQTPTTGATLPVDGGLPEATPR